MAGRARVDLRRIYCYTCRLNLFPGASVESIALGREWNDDIDTRDACCFRDRGELVFSFRVDESVKTKSLSIVS